MATLMSASQIRPGFDARKFRPSRFGAIPRLCRPSESWSIFVQQGRQYLPSQFHFFQCWYMVSLAAALQLDVLQHAFWR
ncbi:hypothetical protein [Mangrovicoccus ximenensis]|uniref:hypothetical protein n=1 Tax=Mangrovicoccus ximenensis TaxID=1911570 RepID=UPI001F2337A6|nr:hypothetical protein [Mangrovicoccus ximenensis]